MGTQIGFKSADRRDVEESDAPLALPAREFMENARVIWDELGCRRSPSMRPGTATRWAIGASAGRVRQTRGDRRLGTSGLETLARERKGLKPETPVKSVEKTIDDAKKA